MENYENPLLAKEKQFNKFLIKSIKLSSLDYLRKKSNIVKKERTIVDDEDFASILHKFSMLNCSIFDMDNIDLSLELNNALHTLSAIEQAVIFLLFQEDLTQNEVAEILKIYSKTVSKIKIRAITKLKKYMERDVENEE